MSRGARKQPIFVADEDVGMFLDLLAELPERFGTRIHGHALMPNHVHLLIESSGRLSVAMRHLFGGYSRRLNERYVWDGPVWKGRFRSRVVTDDRYWRHVLAYLHLNPVRAGLVATPAASATTSHCAYAGLAAPPDWLTTADLLASFGGRRALVDYVEDVRLKREAGPPDWDNEALWPLEGRATAAPSGIGLPTAFARLEERLGVSMADLRTAQPGPPGNRARWVAAWWLVREAALSNREVAAALNASPAAVSRWVRRVLTESATPGAVADLRERLGSAR